VSKADWQSGGSFIPYPYPVDFPDADIEDTPKVSLCFNESWLPWVLGALKVLARSETWDTDQEASDALVEQGMRLQRLVNAGCETPPELPNWELELTVSEGFVDQDMWLFREPTNVGGVPAEHYRLLCGYLDGVGCDVTIRGKLKNSSSYVGGHMLIDVAATNPALVEVTTWLGHDCSLDLLGETAINTPYTVDQTMVDFEFLAGYFAESNYLLDFLVIGDYVCLQT
jgi:hypothetical protein